MAVKRDLEHISQQTQASILDTFYYTQLVWSVSEKDIQNEK